MRKFTTSFVTVLLLLCFTTGYSQSCDLYVASIKSGENILLATKDIPVDNDSSKLMISKLNTTGAEIWRVMYNEPGLREGRIFDGPGDFFFVLVAYEYTAKICKISKVNGSRIWQSQLFNNNTYMNAHVLVGKEKLLVLTRTTPYSTNPGFLAYTIEMGNTPVTELIYQSTEVLQGNPVLDSKGNVIYGYRYVFNDVDKPLIRKINGFNFDAVIWEKGYQPDIVGGTSPTLPMLRNILIDPFDNLYLLSRQEDADMFKVDSNNGNVIWALNNPLSSISGGELSDYKFYEGHLYISYKYVAFNNTSGFLMRKFNMDTGVRSWTTQALHVTAPPLTSSTLHNQAIFGFDLDCAGDIYATGYCAGLGFGPGAWGAMKINGMTGSKIADKIFDNDMQRDEVSSGHGAYVFNNHVLFIGEKQYTGTDYYDRARVAFVTDTNLANIGTAISPCGALSTEEISGPVIEIFPNPTNDILYLRIENSATISSIALYAMDGSKIGSWDKNLEQISIGGYPQGMYLLKITLTNGETVYKKIIKK